MKIPGVHIPGAVRDVTERSKSLRWTAYCAGASFVCMLFNLVALGVPWYYKSDCNATLLYCMARNMSFAKVAGDPGFAFLFLGGLLHLFALLSLYARWAARASCIPHSALACVIFFGVSAFCFLLSVSIYGGKINSFSKTVTNGKYGPGFGLAIFILFIETLSAIALWVYRKEIGDDAGASTTGDSLPAPVTGGATPSDPGRAYAEQTINANNFNVSQIANRWSKSKAHSTALFLAILDLLFVIISMGLPWWNGNGFSYGLIQFFTRLSSSDLNAPLRKAGDPAFAFTFLAFLAQIYTTMAVTLRFLGRNDGFSGRIPHSLTACVISNGVSCLCCFFAFVIYAGVFNTNEKNLFGQFGGGFALILINWLVIMSVILVLLFKRKEVDEAHSQQATAPHVRADTGNPLTLPTPFPLYPQAAAQTYPQSYPQDASAAYASEDLDASGGGAGANGGGSNPFDNKGFVASPSAAVV